jgi:hypothetical protein
MEMIPKDFIQLAHELYRRFNNEAAFRSAISRSYYGLYNLMNRFLVSNNIALPSTGKAHDLTYKYLHNCEDLDVQKLAKVLDDLHDDRNKADYQLELTQFNDSQCAVMAYLKANTAYNDFEKLTSNSSNRKKIIKGVIAYKNKTQS